MIILHICETVPGGIGGYLDEVLCKQVEENEQVYVLVPESHLHFFNAELEGLNVVTYNRTGRNISSLWALFKSIFKTYKSVKPSIMICHSTFSGFIGRLFHVFISKYKSTKLIYYPHGVSMIMKTNSKIKNHIFALLERLLAKIATDKIVCVSNYELKVMKKYSVGINKLCLIYNGITSSDCEIKSKDCTHKNIRILFVGRFDREKGLYNLVHAIEGIDRLYDFRVIGGETKYQETLNFPSDTENLGWLKRTEIVSQYRWADVVVVPSEWEAMGLVAVEAMSNKTAVIATRVGGLIEVIKDNNTGFLYDLNDNEKLTKLLNDTSLQTFHEFGENGYQRYKNEFSSSLMNRKTSELLSEVATL